MNSHNITVSAGSTIRLPTAGKYCDRDIVIKAKGGGTCEIFGSHPICFYPTNYIPDENVKIEFTNYDVYAKFLDETGSFYGYYIDLVNCIQFQTDGHIKIEGLEGVLEFDGENWICIYIDGEDTYTYPLPYGWGIIDIYNPYEVSKKQFDLFERLVEIEDYSGYQIGYNDGYYLGYLNNTEILSELMEWSVVTDSGACVIYVLNKHWDKYLHATVSAVDSSGTYFEEEIVVEPGSNYSVLFTSSSDARWTVDVEKVRFTIYGEGA